MDLKAKKMIEEDVSPLRYKIFMWMAAHSGSLGKARPAALSPLPYFATKWMRRSTTSW